MNLFDYLSQICTLVTTMTTLYFFWISKKRQRELNDVLTRSKIVDSNLETLKEIQQFSHDQVITNKQLQNEIMQLRKEIVELKGDLSVAIQENEQLKNKLRQHQKSQ